MNCKFCDKEGNYSFGWLDAKGEWRDRHLTCEEHAPLSMTQQNFSVDLEQATERMKLFGKATPFISNCRYP